MNYGDRVYSSHPDFKGQAGVIIAKGTAKWFVNNIPKDKDGALTMMGVFMDTYGALWETKPIYVVEFDGGTQTITLEEFLFRVSRASEIKGEIDD